MNGVVKCANKTKRPLRVLQFGEGNFLRAFAEVMFNTANAAGVTDLGVAIVTPTPRGSTARFRDQENIYTVLERGMENGSTVSRSRIITCVEQVYHCRDDFDAWMALAAEPSLRFVVSNTTEAGIRLHVPDHMDGLPDTYPGKLTKFLYARYRRFFSAADKGLIVLPVELIEKNGDTLHACIAEYIKAWDLPDDFARWVDKSCVFCNTLVDRIVTGFPQDGAEAIFAALGYRDALLDVCEPFSLWVIEDRQGIRGELPLPEAGLPVVFTDDLTPYRERKVRVLNGAHTASVSAGLLCGLGIVRDCMHDADLGTFIRRVVKEEIVPFVPLPTAKAEAFAAAVFERFENPYIDHALLSIALNSVSKWKTRVLPSFRDYYTANGSVPRLITFSFAALLALYRADAYAVRDDAAVLHFFTAHGDDDDATFVTASAAQTAFWGEDLTQYDGFCETVLRDFRALRTDARRAVRTALTERG